MSASTVRLPVPGPAFGQYPERQLTPPGWLQRWLQGGLRPATLGPQRGFITRVRQAQALVPAVGSEAFDLALRGLRAELGLRGLQDAMLVQAFALVAQATEHSLGLRLFDSQLAAARLLLDNRLVEMATGEGKTHATMLAAATAALAGVPVHVITANPYLAARDAAGLAPLYERLGLRVAAAQPADREDQRRAVWAADVAYTTPRDLIFDYLRDRQRQAERRLPPAGPDAPRMAPAAPPPLLRGLCMALIDEADSVLIDEARTPFILAQEQHDKAATRRWRAALSAARRLREGLHFERQPTQPRVQLTEAGRLACPADAGPERDPLWAHDHHRTELVETALAALHLYQPQVHYLLVDEPPAATEAAAGASATLTLGERSLTGSTLPGDAPATGAPRQRVEILDPTTGRVTPGRRWSAGLHQLIELKHGLPPSPLQRTSAQLSFQRFFPRYWRLAGTSGTLGEARRELLATYGLRVKRVALRVPDARQWGRDVLYAEDGRRWAKVARLAAAHHKAGRPVLVGCDSIADAERISQMLSTMNLPHQRLDATQDAQEAALVAAAGQRGAITVATRLAGRGTDIRLGAGVRELGGLQVIDAQVNGSARIDRQLHGRCARGGEPGTVTRLHSLDAALYQQELPAAVRRALKRLAALRPDASLPAPLAAALRRAVQLRVQSRERRQRRLMREHDEALARQLGFGGRAD